MKKIFTTLMAFCLGLFVSITIVACADELIDGDSGLVNSEELQSLKDLVTKLSEEVSKLKTTTENQDAKIAELTERVTELEKGDCVTYFHDQSEGDWYSATFNYDAEGRIISVIYKNSEGRGNTENVSYTETGCTFGGKTIKGTTLRALNNAIMVWCFH